MGVHVVAVIVFIVAAATAAMLSIADVVRGYKVLQDIAMASQSTMLRWRGSKSMAQWSVRCEDFFGNAERGGQRQAE